jgi:RNA polymerase sigma factor (sigma-70 family)
LFQDVAQRRLLPPEAKARENHMSSRGFTDASFDELFLAHHAKIVAILSRVVGDWGRAEELANEVFLKLYRRRLCEIPGGNLAGWLYRTAMNLGIDALRSRARRKRYELAAALDGLRLQAPETPFDNLARSENEQRVRAVLADLKPDQAELLILRASGHSYRELADVFGVQPGAIGTRLLRAEAAFEKRYRQKYNPKEAV